jgi:hypothetical protein
VKLLKNREYWIGFAASLSFTIIALRQNGKYRGGGERGRESEKMIRERIDKERRIRQND